MTGDQAFDTFPASPAPLDPRLLTGHVTPRRGSALGAAMIAASVGDASQAQQAMLVDEILGLRAVLVRLRDCDRADPSADRMHQVREIARAALNANGEEVPPRDRQVIHSCPGGQDFEVVVGMDPARDHPAGDQSPQARIPGWWGLLLNGQSLQEVRWFASAPEPAHFGPSTYGPGIHEVAVVPMRVEFAGQPRPGPFQRSRDLFGVASPITDSGGEG